MEEKTQGKNVEIAKPEVKPITEVKPTVKPIVKLLVKKLTATAKVPTKGSAAAAGYDLYADGDWVIPPRVVLRVSTGLAIAIPLGYVGLLCDRSGMAARGVSTKAARMDIGALIEWLGAADPAGYLGVGEHVLGGVIDSDYRGEWQVILYNSNADVSYIVKRGDRIAQFLILPVPTVAVVLESEVVKELPDTERGTGGFGSTGV